MLNRIEPKFPFIDDLRANVIFIFLDNCKRPCVLGHVRLARITSKAEAVWIESVVLHPDLRGKGYGKYLMLITEKFARDVKGYSEAYLCTIDRQIFYSRCGYVFCDPVCAYSGNIKLPSGLTASKTQWGSEQTPLKQTSKDVSQPDMSGALLKTEKQGKFDKLCQSNKLNSKPVEEITHSPVQIPNCDTQSTSLNREMKEKTIDIDNVTDVSVLCAKLYCRPSFPCNPPTVITGPLRSLEKKNNGKIKNSSGEICRATIPKDYMKKKL